MLPHVLGSWAVQKGEFCITCYKSLRFILKAET
jgi:hypothetical protein